MEFIDTHAHLYDEAFDGDFDETVARIKGNGVVRCIFPAIDSTTFERQRNAAEKCGDFAVQAIGLHPTSVAENWRKELDFVLEEVERNNYVAIGEIGLDYYWEPYDKTAQRICFESQLELARELSLPVIIHDREAHGDCFETVLRYPEVKGVFHSYSGSAEMARELIKRGWYISFSGVISFKNAAKVKEVALVVPEDRILIETDAPYLAPHPFRGKINHSGRLIHTAAALAEARGCDVDRIAKITYDNTKALFGIKES